MVLDETTEEGRLFQTGIVLGKMSFSGHHYRQIVLYSVIHAMPEFALGWVPGQVFVFIKRHCTGVYLPAGLQGWPLKLVKHITDATGVPPSPAGPPGCSLLHLLHLNNSQSFIIGMPNRSCILKLRTNQCFVCNFFSMPRCRCQIAPKKAQRLSCLACNMLTPRACIPS